ncbi:MAG TPA: EamA family transporter [Chloroflexota bacterium]|jgi:multidrug transporter EmrE-like cation transporter
MTNVAASTSSLLMIVFAIICGVAGQLTLKLGMTAAGRIDGEALSRPMQTLIATLGNPMVLGGLSFYVLGAVAWLTVLSRVPLSYAYPILAAGYAITPILAWLILNESVPSMRWMGIGTICLGVLLVSRT